MFCFLCFFCVLRFARTWDVPLHRFELIITRSDLRPLSNTFDGDDNEGDDDHRDDVEVDDDEDLRHLESLVARMEAKSLVGLQAGAPHP